jgi:hypothetical protein
MYISLVEILSNRCGNLPTFGNCFDILELLQP